MISNKIYNDLQKSNPINAVVVFGSSRSDGNTSRAIQNVFDQLKYELPVADLNQLKVNEYRYEFDQEDDFHELIQLLIKYDVIILASPIYWYSVSAKMKCFIDRLSDLLSIDKDTGRKLRGKNLATIASYLVYPEGLDGFEQPLINSAEYLGMGYLGTYFHCSGTDKKGLDASESSLAHFVDRLIRA